MLTTTWIYHIQPQFQKRWMEYLFSITQLPHFLLSLTQLYEKCCWHEVDDKQILKKKNKKKTAVVEIKQ